MPSPAAGPDAAKESVESATETPSSPRLFPPSPSHAAAPWSRCSIRLGSSAPETPRQRKTPQAAAPDTPFIAHPAPTRLPDASHPPLAECPLPSVLPSTAIPARLAASERRKSQLAAARGKSHMRSYSPQSPEE